MAGEVLFCPKTGTVCLNNCGVAQETRNWIGSFKSGPPPTEGQIGAQHRRNYQKGQRGNPGVPVCPQ